MKRIKSHLAALILIVLFGASTVAVVGCSAEQIQHTAENVRYVAGGPKPTDATTQPSAGQTALDVAHDAVISASNANPAFGALASLVALIAGGVAGIAGNARGKKVATKQAKGVISEIVDDVKAYNQPAVPWSAATKRLLEDLGYVEAAKAIDSVTSSAPPANG